MAEVTVAASKKTTGFSKSHHRRSTRVDLTPMVDLGFLLITFFVFTTSMSEAKVMPLLQTKDGPDMPKKESAVMTIILGGDQRIAYYFGLLDEPKAGSQILPSDFKKIRSLIAEKKKTTDEDFLMYIIKADSTATFGSVINLLDEMAICDIPQGHYCEADITTTESDFINHKLP